MDINKLLDGINCSCGKSHSCNIDHVFIGNNAFSHLSDICSPFHKLLIVADENTFAAAGHNTISALSGKHIQKLIFPGNKILVPDEVAIDRITQQLDGIDLIIGIGSGVIQDLCKFVSFYNKIPYIIVATAPSMDGYASDGAAMITNGMKVTYKTGLPRAIIADSQVLANAPINMIKAGYGDIIGKFSALNDWKLSHLVTGEYFCDFIYDLTYRQILNAIKLAPKLLSRSHDSINAIMEALVTIGILMSFAGSSRPASGSEHHLAHFFEITGIINNENYFPHGIDVAYSTVITAEIRENILSGKFPDKIFRESESDYENNIKAIYKNVADGCIALQRKVGNYSADRSAIYLQKEPQIRAVLSEMPSKNDIIHMLSLAKLDMNDFYSVYSKEKIRNAITYAKDLKDRYTVLWMNYDFYGNKI